MKKILTPLLNSALAAGLSCYVLLGQEAAPAQERSALRTIEADVCVYGGTSAGVTAALQAGRMGRSVVLIEPCMHLGGMTSSGLEMTDNGATHTIGGLAREFYERIYRYYSDPQSWQHGTRPEFVAWLPNHWGVDGPKMEELKAQFLFEPHVAEGVFNDLVRDAGVKVIFGERLDLVRGVRKDSTKITAIVMESGGVFAARVFVDATYEGDLMARSGVKYIVGREPTGRRKSNVALAAAAGTSLLLMASLFRGHPMWRSDRKGRERTPPPS